MEGISYSLIHSRKVDTELLFTGLAKETSHVKINKRLSDICIETAETMAIGNLHNSTRNRLATLDICRVVGLESQCVRRNICILMVPGAPPYSVARMKAEHSHTIKCMKHLDLDEIYVELLRRNC